MFTPTNTYIFLSIYYIIHRRLRIFAVALSRGFGFRSEFRDRWYNNQTDFVSIKRNLVRVSWRSSRLRQRNVHWTGYFWCLLIGCFPNHLTSYSHIHFIYVSRNIFPARNRIFFILVLSPKFLHVKRSFVNSSRLKFTFSFLCSTSFASYITFRFPLSLFVDILNVSLKTILYQAAEQRLSFASTPHYTTTTTTTSTSFFEVILFRS